VGIAIREPIFPAVCPEKKEGIAIDMLRFVLIIIIDNYY
jgi:hypothetical protein